MNPLFRQLEQQLAPFLPHVEAWIDDYLARTAAQARPVAARGFPRLGDCYSTATLATAKVVYATNIEKPPLGALGLRGFEEFERMDVAGITYKDTFFARPELKNDESLHFHKLVHVIQWRTAGPRGFILAYAAGLAVFGYRESPLEVMAYDWQDRFDARQPIRDLEGEIETATRAILADPTRGPAS